MLELISLYPDSLAVAGLVVLLILNLTRRGEEVCRYRPRSRWRRGR